MPDLWSGRLPGGLDPRARDFTGSLALDWRLASYDIRGSLAHVRMLGAVGILSPEETASITAGLETLLAEVESGAPPWDPTAEDVHSAVESELTVRLGAVAGKLHTARSRNDQVALDLHLYVVDVGHSLTTQVDELVAVLTAKATAWKDLPMPGYTHMQPAQAVTLGHHMLAYVWMLMRDRDRLGDLIRRTNRSPLGAGALAGTTLPIDPDLSARLLHTLGAYENSLDAVSDRDFVVECLATLSLIMVHLSRLAEELVYWTGREFGFLQLPDAWATGSSMMPQKKNPDVAELIRGRSGGVFGNLAAMLTLLKGLPLSYNRDMQEDKGLLFQAVDTVSGSLIAASGLIEGLTPVPENLSRRLSQELLATDWAEQLVVDGMPFRDAHREVARRFHDPEAPVSTGDTLGDIRQSIAQRDRAMGPGPGSIADQINKVHKILHSGIIAREGFCDREAAAPSVSPGVSEPDGARHAGSPRRRAASGGVSSNPGDGLERYSRTEPGEAPHRLRWSSVRHGPRRLHQRGGASGSAAGRILRVDGASSQSHRLEGHAGQCPCRRCRA